VKNVILTHARRPSFRFINPRSQLALRLKPVPDIVAIAASVFNPKLIRPYCNLMIIRCLFRACRFHFPFSSAEGETTIPAIPVPYTDLPFPGQPGCRSAPIGELLNTIEVKMSSGRTPRMSRFFRALPPERATGIAAVRGKNDGGAMMVPYDE
jgi:hypothetical protein